jgi:hypothetical protein
MSNTATQSALALADTPAQIAQASTPMDMIRLAFQSAIEQGSSLEVVDRILAHQKEMMEYQDKVAFNGALARVQANARRIRANAENPQTRSKYANFAALDSVMRPLYVAEGLSLSFDTADVDKPDTVRVVCDVSLGGYTRRYHIDMPADGKGAKGNDVMTKTHATGSAISYGKRYLLLMIFNLAVGENDDDGNAAGGNPSGMRKNVLDGWLDKMRRCTDPGQLTATFREAYATAERIGDKAAMFDIIACNKAEKGRYQ